MVSATSAFTRFFIIVRVLPLLAGGSAGVLLLLDGYAGRKLVRHDDCRLVQA